MTKIAHSSVIFSLGVVSASSALVPPLPLPLLCVSESITDGDDGTRRGSLAGLGGTFRLSRGGLSIRQQGRISSSPAPFSYRANLFHHTLPTSPVFSSLSLAFVFCPSRLSRLSCLSRALRHDAPRVLNAYNKRQGGNEDGASEKNDAKAFPFSRPSAE